MSPATDLEIVYVTGTFLVSGAFYAYIIGAVCNIAESMNLRNHQYYEAMDTLNRCVAPAGQRPCQPKVQPGRWIEPGEGEANTSAA